MTGSAYRFLPPHTCHGQRVATNSVWGSVYGFVGSEEQMAGQGWKRTVRFWVVLQLLAESLAAGVRDGFERCMANMLHGCLLLWTGCFCPDGDPHVDSTS